MIKAVLNVHYKHLTTWQRWYWMFFKSAIEIDIPTDWADIPEKRRMKVVEAMMKTGQVSPDTQRLLLFRAMVPMSSRLFFRIKNIDWAEKLLPYIDWVLVTPINNPFNPTIKIGGASWRIATAEVKDMTVATYFQVEKYWSELSSGHNDSLYYWLAAFLRPDTQEVNDHYRRTGLLPNISAVMCQDYAQQLQQITSAQAYYLIQYYSAQRVMLKAKYESLFNGDGSGKGTGKTQWDTIPAKIAESGVFGSLHDVLTTPAIIYLSWANSKADQAAKDENKSLQDLIRAQHQKFLN